MELKPLVVGVNSTTDTISIVGHVESGDKVIHSSTSMED